jgi:3',5'-cyclic AMP phosphodiesterase CpdA
MVDVKTEGEVETKIETEPFSFSLAHLADLHLTSLDSIKIPQLFNKRILGYCSWRRKRRIVHRREIIDSLVEDLRVTCPDHITVTGDLTHLGLPMEYAEVAKWLPSLGTPNQVTVIPGNHDAYAGRNWFRSCAMWAPYLESDTALDIHRTADFFPSLRIRGQVALIGLSSARPSPPFFATGALGQEQLAALDALLEKTGDKGLLRIVLIHHPPLPGIVNWRKCLTDSKPFAAVLAKRGAELVLHGHAHTPSIAEIQTPSGMIPVVGAPATSEFNPQAGRSAKYNIYRMSRTGKDWQLTMSVRGYSEEQGCFVSESERSLKLPSTRVKVPKPSFPRV